MSSQKKIDTEVSKEVDLPELIAKLEEDQLKLISDLVFKRQADIVNGRIGQLPALAHNEFKEFDDREVDRITDKVLEIRRRRYVAFVYYYSHFDQTDDQVVRFIRQCNQELSYVQAVRDLNKIKGIIGNMPRAHKELIRYQVIEMHKMAYQKAEQNNDPKSMAVAANGISQAANLDKDDPDMPWEKMIPPMWEPTDDLAALGDGFEKRQNLETDIARLKKKYGDVEDIDEI